MGVVEDGKYRTLSEDPQPAMFFPILQSPSSYTIIIVRSSRDARQLATSLQETLRNLNTGLPFTINTWTKELDTALFAARAASLALGVLGGLGAMLAVTGIFGMAAYSVSKRLRELGIRIALGANRSEVLSTALGRAFRLLVIGSLTGLALGLAATKLLSFIVYQATPRDPLVLTGVVVFMLLLGLWPRGSPAASIAADPLVLLRDGDGGSVCHHLPGGSCNNRRPRRVHWRRRRDTFQLPCLFAPDCHVAAGVVTGLPLASLLRPSK